MTLEERVSELEEQWAAHWAAYELLTESHATPEELKLFLQKLLEGADAVAEIRGKQDQMDKRVDDSQKWMQFHSRVLMGIGLAIIGILVSIAIGVWNLGT